MKASLFLVLFLLLSCGGDSDSTPDFDVHQDAINTSKSIFDSGKVLYPAIKNNPNFDKLIACGLNYEGTFCSPETTPLIHKEGQEITPEVVLKYTLTSHEFLAEIFERFLKDSNNKYLLKMFGSVSGVVLTDEISSSFYTSRTGMIYIDARYLWQTNEQYAQLELKEDTRGAPNPKKNIEVSHAYYKDGKKLSSQYNKNERVDSDNFGMLTRLFFHELAHAMDYFPPSIIDTLPSDQTYRKISYDRLQSKSISSDKLGYAKSDTIWEYASFFYYNETTDGKIPSLTKKEFLDNFVEDNSVSLYSYTSKREHLAMLIEAYMMIYTEDAQECLRIWNNVNENYEFFWAQENRVLEQSVFPYAQKAIRLIFASNDSSQLLSQSAPVSPLRNSSPEYSREACFKK